MTAKDETFAEEYLWLRSFAMPHTRIAQLMGLSDSALAKRCERAGLRRHVDTAVQRRLQDLIDSGAEFDVLSFPFRSDIGVIASAVSDALRHGRIAEVGTRRDPLSNKRIRIYQGASERPRLRSETKQRDPAA